MKTFVSLSACITAACFTAVVLLGSLLVAQDKAKEVTLKGQLMCAKCALNQTTDCTTAIQVKEGDKLFTYYLDDKGVNEEYHAAICGGEKKEGTVVGTVSEKQGQKYIKPSKVTYAK
jgi:hypothetical protein